MAGSPLTHETRLRVRYGEVDRMGVVYHGHYLVYFEQGRTELLRSVGIRYRDVEESGTLLVVSETGLHYHAPARYDDELMVHTTLANVGRVRVRFEYEVRRGAERLTTGHTVLASTDRSGRPKRLPVELRDLLVPPGTGESGTDGSDRNAGADSAVQGPGS